MRPRHAMRNNVEGEVHKPLSLRLPEDSHHLSGRVHRSHIDIRFNTHSERTTPVEQFSDSSEDNCPLDRRYFPSHASIEFEDGKAESQYNLKLSALAQPLAQKAGVPLTPEVVRASRDINVHFSNPSASEMLGSDSRRIVSRLSRTPFSPHRFVWRLASIYLTAVWAAIHKDGLRASHDLPEIFSINSISSFSGSLGHAYASKVTQPIVFDSDEPASDTRKLLPIIALAASQDPKFRTSKRLELPSVSRQWPKLPPTCIYFIGQLETIPLFPSVITPSLALKAAALWCRKHGCEGLLEDYIDAISIFWTSNDPSKTPIFEADELCISLPPLNTQSTILLPICSTNRRAGSPCRLEALCTFDNHALLCRGVNTRLLLSFLMRVSTSDVSKEGIGHNQTENAVPNMDYVEPLAWMLGYSGNLGHGLKSAAPVYSRHTLKDWWSQYKPALHNAYTLFPDTVARLAHKIVL